MSEVMLQQTRVEVVRDYYSRWMTKFPTVSALANSSEGEVLHLWQGLGYYSRARRLREGAQFVKSEFGGELPKTPEQLLRVPGIGPYSAGAISSIAFNQPSAIVDGNVIRVLSRYFALAGDPNKKPLKQLLWALAGQLVPRTDPGTFNQALMEFGATLCTPKSPMCHACPLSKTCAALSQGRVQSLPELPKPKEKTAITLAVIVFRKPDPKKGEGATRETLYGFVNLPRDARWWAQLDVFPFCEVPDGAELSQVARSFAKTHLELGRTRGKILQPVRHTVTRFDLRLVPVVFDLGAPVHASSDLRWVSRQHMKKLALPSAYKKVVTQVDQNFPV